MIDFQRIRQAVDIEEVARWFGLEVHNRKTRCPFHNDKTSSLSFAKDHYKCFGCDESGDATDLVAKLRNVSVTEAAQRITKEFHLAVTFSSVLWLANLIFPVGSIRMTVSAADASTFLGGTWVRWGTGRVPVGVNTSDANFNTVEKTGGVSSQALSATEMPPHNHSFSGSVTVNANGAHTHQA